MGIMIGVDAINLDEIMLFKKLLWIVIGNQEKSQVGKPFLIPWPLMEGDCG
jgi:hypothetical protein